MNGVAEQIFADLASFHAMVGLGACSHEAAICRHIAASFFRRGTPAFACIAYPDAARGKDHVTRDECDLVVRVRRTEWLWVEAKQIWKPDGAGHWLWVDAVKDVDKLSSLSKPEAAHVGLLLIGLDKTVRERSCLQRDIETRFADRAHLQSWQQASRSFEPRHGRRVNAWFWWRSLG